MNNLIPKWLNPFSNTQQQPTPEALAENVRKFGNPGISVYGRSPVYHQPGWQVRVPLDGLTMMEHNGRRYAMYDKEIQAKSHGPGQSYEVTELPLNRGAAPTLLAEFAPGQFIHAGRYNPARKLEDCLNDQLRPDPNGDPNGTLEDYLDRMCQQILAHQEQYQPQDLVIRNQPAPEGEYAL